MKVYVCYCDTEYDGCSEPEAVFKSQDAASSYCLEAHDEDGWNYYYVELELK